MCKDIKHVLARCGTCRLFNTQKPHVELGRMPVAYYPHQIVSMDLVGPFPRSRFGHSYLFTLIDHLTGWADAYPIAHKNSGTIANILASRYFPQYNSPEILISDNRTEFCNAEVNGLLSSYGIKHNRTTAYNPASNEKIEIFHRTLKSILRKLVHKCSSDWETQLGPALMAYRNTLHTSTGFSPFECLYGRKGRLAFQKSVNKPMTDTNNDRFQTLHSTWRMARQQIDLTRQDNERLVLSKWTVADKLNVGGSVLLLKR